MITPEEYLKKYQKVSNLISLKIINTIIAIMLITLFGVFLTQNHILIITVYLVLLVATFLIGKLLLWYKIKVLNQLIYGSNKKNHTIDEDTYKEELKSYIIDKLSTILEDNGINKEMYEKFFRNQLNEIYKEKKNILTDKPYITFMLGAIFVSFVNSFYNFPFTNITNNIHLIISTTFALLFIVALISFVIYSFDSTILNKSRDIKKLISYTDLIMYSNYKHLI